MKARRTNNDHPFATLLAEAAVEATWKKEPTLSVRGILAKYGPAPSAEEIDRNRSEMFANFHAASWYLFSDPRLGLAASDFIEATIAAGDYIGISVIADAKNVLQEVQLDSGMVTDFPDRIIAATALFYRVPVLSRDGRIRSSNIQTVWQLVL